jgi:ribosomal protein L14E/L6E/L27E
MTGVVVQKNRDIPICPKLKHMKVGAFVIDIKDGHFQDKWKAYYSRFCDEAEILIDDTPDVDDVNLKFQLITPKLAAKQKELLSRNDVVIYPEIDEYLVPDPDKYKDLRDYVERFYKSSGIYCRATGFNMIQIMGEPKIEWDKTFTAQRRYWSKSNFYSKNVMSKVPTTWAHGMMGIKVININPDPDLYLVHLKYADFEEELKRGKERHGYKEYNQMLDTFLDVAKDAQLIPEKWRVI